MITSLCFGKNLNLMEQLKKICFAFSLMLATYQSTNLWDYAIHSILDVHTVQTIHDLDQGKEPRQLT